MWDIPRLSVPLIQGAERCKAQACAQLAEHDSTIADGDKGAMHERKILFAHPDRQLAYVGLIWMQATYPAGENWASEG